VISVENRAAVADHLQRRGVPFRYYYELTLPEWMGVAGEPVLSENVDKAPTLKTTNLALPIHAYLQNKEIRWIADAVRHAVDRACDVDDRTGR
jgi:dTDP-4-amino-4,6-dideoxygalactose transaminase